MSTFEIVYNSKPKNFIIPCVSISIGKHLFESKYEGIFIHLNMNSTEDLVDAIKIFNYVGITMIIHNTLISIKLSELSTKESTLHYKIY